MKTYHRIRFSIRSTAARILFPAAVIAAAAIPASADVQDAAKTHTLFMGANIFVGKDNELYPVKDVNGSSWVVDVKGQTKVISTQGGPINIKITPSLKLTEVSANVANLKGERGYTYENDPITRQTRALVRAADLNAGYQASVNQANAALDHATGVVSSTVNMSGTQGQALINKGYIATGPQTPTNNAPAQYVQAANIAAASSGSDLELYGDRGVASGFDAMDVTFDVSSERLLGNPYVVTVTRFHPKGTNPDVVQNLVYAKSLDPIDAHTKSIHFIEGGFPNGFELLDFQVHFYNRGEEIATTVSAKRVPLTRDEAFEYVKIEYEGAHKADTLPAVPAMGKLPADLPARLAEGKYRETIYVMVSKDGLPNELFQDAACSKKVEDPYLESAVKNIRFKPALEKGKPVDSVAPLKLGQLAI